jgi:hypothetical protein
MGKLQEIVNVINVDYSQRHEDAWGEWRYRLTVLELCSGWRRVVSFQLRQPYPMHPFGRRAGWTRDLASAIPTDLSRLMPFAFSAGIHVSYPRNRRWRRIDVFPVTYGHHRHIRK